MTVQVRLNERDFLAAQLLNFRPKPLVRWVLIGALVMIALLFAAEGWAIAHAAALPAGWWILPSGLGYGALLFFIVLPWRVTKIFKQNPALAEPTELTFADDGVSLGAGPRQIRFPWKAMQQWKWNRHFILLYHSSAHFHILPKRCFAKAEDFDLLVGMLRERMGAETP